MDRLFFNILHKEELGLASSESHEVVHLVESHIDNCVITVPSDCWEFRQAVLVLQFLENNIHNE
jgi:hypothetical protein